MADLVARGARRHLPHARQLAWSEYTRNTLAAHANAFPAHWAGTISVDDACYAFYAQHPDYCGAIRSPYDGQITEQPTWMVMNAVSLAGITPTEAGYAIAPHLPFTRFSLRLPEVGLAARPGLLRGYLVTQRTTSLELEVRIPAGARTRTIVSWAGRGRVRHRVAHGSVVHCARRRRPPGELGAELGVAPSVTACGPRRTGS